MAAQWGVSVILPVFFPAADASNCTRLSRALASVFVQDFPGPFEIIVVDDGSTPPLQSLSDAIAESTRPEIRWLRSPRNSGLVDALNRGLAAAKHPFIARLDADDAWAEGKIEKQFALFRSDPDLSIVGTGMSLVSERGDHIDDHIRPGDWTGILRFCHDIGCPFPHGSIVARSDVYGHLGGYSAAPQTRHCEDFELWARWLRFFKPAMVEEPLYLHTVSANSVSGQYAAQQQRATAHIAQRFRDLALVDSLPEALAEVAAHTGVSVLAAGLAACRLWNYSLAVIIPKAAVAPMKQILKDRTLLQLNDFNRPVWNFADLVPAAFRQQHASDGPSVIVRALP